MTSYILVIPQILLIILIIPLPETPYLLIEQGLIKKARKSLQFFRGKLYDISDELNEIQQKHESKQVHSNNNSWKFTIKRIFSAAFLKPFSCVGILYCMNSWLGFSPLLTYTFEILDKAGSKIDTGLGLIVIGSIRIAFAGMYW